MVRKETNIIAAVALNGAIGRDNALMWNLHGDMRFFRETTTGGAVIMGRRTFESIGRPLPKRLNIVVSRGCPKLPEGVVLAGSVEDAVRLAQEGLSQGMGGASDGDIFVIGGGQIYREAMAFADKLLITRVFLNPSDADTFFPEILSDQWIPASRSEAFEEDGVGYAFETWIRA